MLATQFHAREQNSTDACGSVAQPTRGGSIATARRWFRFATVGRSSSQTPIASRTPTAWPANSFAPIGSDAAVISGSGGNAHCDGVGDHAAVGSTLDSERVQTVLARLRGIGEQEDAAAKPRVRAREDELGTKFYGLELCLA